MKYLLTAALLIAAGVSAQNTTRHGLKTPQSAHHKPAATVQAAPCDTIVAPKAHTVDINGYDKPLRSKREIFFATNNSSDTIAAISYTITYYDTKRRMLHRQSRHTDVTIPAGETRQVNIPSWDKQCIFYYINSAVPQRTAKATPYEVTLSVDTLFVR